MLKVENVDLFYGAAPALRSVSVEAQVGKVACVLGRNGVGKTSLLRAIVGHQPIAGGVITLGGTDISKLASYERARRGIAYVPQGREIFPLLSVKENLETGFAPLSRSERFVLIVFDVISSFPSRVLALAAVALFGPSTGIVMVIVAVTLIPHFGRVARSQTLTIKSAPFLEAERILGASWPRIVFFHVLPNIIGPLVILASMDIPVVITIEAGLSFLGLGVRPPLASWGTLIQDGYQYLSQTWVPVVVSSVALGLATLGFTLFGEALRDAVDPRIGREH